MAKARVSAGVLPYRMAGTRLEVLLVHPGGPFWARRDNGAWSIAKGEPAAGEDKLACARRELAEETGLEPAGAFVALPAVRQAGGKTVHAWATPCDCDPTTIRSNTFTMEWPPKSGIVREYPEVDRAGWFTLAEARTKLIAGQVPLLDALEALARDDALPRG